MLELERDGAVGDGAGNGEAGVRVGDVVRVAGMRKGGERRGGEGNRGVEGVVVRVGGGGAVAVAVGEGGGEEGEEGGEGLEGRLWV